MWFNFIVVFAIPNFSWKLRDCVLSAVGVFAKGLVFEVTINYTYNQIKIEYFKILIFVIETSFIYVGIAEPYYKSYTY